MGAGAAAAKVVLRDAEAGDLPRLVALAASAGAGGWGAESLAQELRRAVARVRVACDAGDPAAVWGFALGWVVGDRAELLSVAVAPEHRRAGVGTLLVRDLARAAAAAGCAILDLEVSAANPAALGLYQALGFVEVGRRPRYYRDGSDAVLMRLGDLERAAQAGGARRAGG